jgi:hypothetical protein
MNIPRQSPLRQIRNLCMDCCGGSVKSVRFCHATECPLWHLRFGKYPKTVIREQGTKAEALFDRANFAMGGRFSPDRESWS